MPWEDEHGHERDADGAEHDLEVVTAALAEANRRSAQLIRQP